MATLQLFRTPTRNHPYRLIPARQDSSPSFHTLVEPSAGSYVDPATPTTPVRPQDIGQDKQTPGLSAGTIAAIVFSGLILIFLLTGVYACAPGRHKTRRGLRSSLGRRSNYYEDEYVADDDIEMRAQRHTQESRSRQQDQNQSQHQHQHQHQRHDEDGQYPYRHEGAGMGYDDEEDGKEAWIEVGTAQIARIRRVPAGSVSITNMGRGKAPVPLGSIQSVRDVVTLPDLAWAESLTTGGGRRPGVVPAPLGASATATALPVSSSKSSSVRSKKVLQERSESRKAVKRKAIKEWCARGSGGGLGPYSGAY